MRGRDQFVTDLYFAGMREAAFLRSPVAHARLRGITIPDAHRKSAFLHRDLDGVRPIRAVSGLRGFKPSEQTPLASNKLRYVDEPVAMCVSSTRAQAEDIAGMIPLELAELPAVHDMFAARDRSSALVHKHWGDNRRQLPRALLPDYKIRRTRWHVARHRLRSHGRSGAYSAYPFSACLEAAQVASILPGPYDFPSYRCRTFSVATNNARPCPIGRCQNRRLFCAGIDPRRHSARNQYRATSGQGEKSGQARQMPFNNITRKHFDSGAAIAAARGCRDQTRCRPRAPAEG